MKKRFGLPLLLALLLVLAACGTDTTTEPDTSEETPEEQLDEVEEGNGSENDGADGEAATPNAEESLTFTQDGEEVTVAASVQTSPELPYEMMVAQGYSLISEEPNKDVVFFEQDDSIFMRLEWFGTDNVDMDMILNSTEAQVAVVAEDVSTSEATLGELNASVYTSESDVQKATAYVMEDLGLKAVIYTPTEVDHTAAFKAMLDTVEEVK
ncbi:hypothetical protein [Bacillus fonticola]|uniref:hypothetical protein n=1 Tax=Bacillus fonticola TaxID=2728853 RepID=UPI001475E644|nr:hypothetical protein [Bacillus fonticola]